MWAATAELISSFLGASPTCQCSSIWVSLHRSSHCLERFSLDTHVTPCPPSSWFFSNISLSLRLLCPASHPPLSTLSLLALLHMCWFLFFLSTCHHRTFYIYIYIVCIYTIYILYTHLLFTCLLLSTLLKCRLQEGKDLSLFFFFTEESRLPQVMPGNTEMPNKFFSMAFLGRVILIEV